MGEYSRSYIAHLGQHGICVCSDSAPSGPRERTTVPAQAPPNDNTCSHTVGVQSSLGTAIHESLDISSGEMRHCVLLADEDFVALRYLICCNSWGLWDFGWCRFFIHQQCYARPCRRKEYGTLSAYSLVAISP